MPNANPEGISDKRLLQEHRRRVLAATDSHGDVAVGATFGLASDIEDVLDRRGVSYASAEEILGARPAAAEPGAPRRAA